MYLLILLFCAFIIRLEMLESYSLIHKRIFEELDKSYCKGIVTEVAN